MIPLQNMRDALRFGEVAKEAFTFLVADYEYTLVRAESAILRYESSRMFVNISHESMSYEINLECGPLPEREESRFTLSVILHGLLGPGHGFPTFFQAHTSDRIRECLAQIARTVATMCGPLLLGDQEALVHVRKADCAESEKTTRYYTVEFIREKANAAWQEKSYGEVCSLYESICDDLTDLERKRLDLAQKKMSAAS